MNVLVCGRPGGAVEYDTKHRRWIWYRNNGGKELFPRTWKRDDVLSFIQRVARTTDVEFEDAK